MNIGLVILLALLIMAIAGIGYELLSFRWYRARCMRCGETHPLYKFTDSQLCYPLYCSNCQSTQMHEPVK